MAYGCFNRNEAAKPDAEVRLINNLAVPSGGFVIPGRSAQLKWTNNFESLPATVFKNPDAMDFALTDEKLKHSGIPVRGQAIPYVGAVDPQKGMWRYGADESKLPTL